MTTIPGPRRNPDIATPADLAMYEVREGLDDDYDVRGHWGTLDAAKAHAEALFDANHGTADLSWKPNQEAGATRHRIVIIQALGDDPADNVEGDLHVVKINLPLVYSDSALS